MSLPDFSTQSFLFSTAGISASLFPEDDRYRLFAQIVYPHLAAARSQLATCYCSDNGRVAVEPVLLLGVSLLQYLDGVPDRRAVEMLHYHVGWIFALNRQLGDEMFHPTTRVNFRARLTEKDLTALGFQTIIDALIQAGLVARQTRQRLDSTQMIGRVSRMSRLECVRESLRLVLQEVAKATPEPGRPAGWADLWERYVESQTDYRASTETLARKFVQAGADAHRVLQWLRLPAQAELAQSEPARLLARVFGEQFDVVASPSAPTPPATPHRESSPVPVTVPAATESASAPRAESVPAAPEPAAGIRLTEPTGPIVQPKGEATLPSDRVPDSPTSAAPVELAVSPSAPTPPPSLNGETILVAPPVAAPAEVPSAAGAASVPVAPPTTASSPTAESTGPRVQPKTKEAVRSDRVQNPHEPEATYASKGEGKARKEHVGYKVQVAESVCEVPLEAGEPTRNFLTGIVTHAAYESDEAGARKMAAEQASMGLDKPPVQYVDAAYISAAELAQAQAEGRELIGPAPATPDHVQGRYTTERFDVDIEQRQAICPAGKTNTQCSRLEEKQTGKVSYRLEWSTHCENCPLRAQCVAPQHKHRSIVVGEHHTALQARRREQVTPEFKRRMKHRNAIEGTQSELVRAHGLRRARYRGLNKVRLQNYLVGAACNVKRWIRREVWNLRRAVSATPAATAPAAN